jgi:protein SCO1
MRIKPPANSRSAIFVRECQAALSHIKAALPDMRYGRPMRLRILLIATAGTVILAAAPALRAERVFTVTGVVAAPLDGGRVVVAHQEIVGFMPAMTMGFDVAGSAMLDASLLAAGDRVRFQLHLDEQHSLADHFQVVGRGATPPIAEPATPPVHRLQVGDLVPDFTLVDENSRPVTRTGLAGHETLITFIFTRCPVPEFCPTLARRFGELQKTIVADPKLNGQVGLLSITLDPEFDRPEVLREYGRAAGAKPNVWHFATGAKTEVMPLVNAFSVYVERNGVALDHTLCTALIDGHGRIVELWRGNDWKESEVLGAMAKALK